MSLFQSLILGIVQGITEFLPVSSYGHLVILQHLMDIEDVPVLFDILLHIATLLVVLFYFRIRVIRLAVGVFRFLFREKGADERREMKTFGILVLGTACTAVIGLFISTLEIQRHELLVYLFFIITGIILITVSRLHPQKQTDDPGISQGLIIGIAQGIGTLPGISRSGITISAAIACGVSRKSAGELSFLFFIPAVIGALVLELLSGEPISGSMSWQTVAVGMISAIAAGFFSLKLLIRMIKSDKLYYFSIYLIPLGIAGLVVLSVV